MDNKQTDEAVSTRARVRISERNGWAAGVEGIAMGYRPTYDNIKVGFVDGEGNYTGEYTMVSRTMVDVVETPEQESERLELELSRLRRTHPDERTDEQREALRKSHARLVELYSVPPAGYSTPKAAADLMAFAKSHGWQTSALWTALGYAGEPYLRVQVGRLVPKEERDEHRGDRWVYELTWHSRDCAPGKTRRFGQGTAVTPDNPATHGAPSVKAIRDVITSNSAAVLSAAA